LFAHWCCILDWPVGMTRGHFHATFYDIILMHAISALETFVTMRCINLHLPLPLPVDTFKQHLKTRLSDSLNLMPLAPLYLRTLWRYTNAVFIIIIIIIF